MKKLYLFFVILSISIYSQAQLLTIDQIIACRTKSVSALEEYLTQRKWEFMKAEEETADSKGTITFSYLKNDFNNDGVAFITLYYQEDLPPLNRIIYEFADKRIYSTALARIKTLGGKLLSTKVTGDMLSKVYKVNKNVINVLTSTEKDDAEVLKTRYKFMVYDAQDYNIISKGLENESVSSFNIDTSVENESGEIMSDTKDYTRALAIQAFEKGNYKDAKTLFLEALSVGVAVNIDYYYLAYSCYSLNDFQNAVRYGSIYANQNPEDEDILEILPFAYFKLGKIKQAVETQNKLCELKESSNNFDILSWYLLLDKQYNLALEYNDRARQLIASEDRNSNFSIQCNAAHINLMLGRVETAKQIYKSNKGKRLWDNKTWQQLILDDFAIMKKFQVTHPRMGEIEIMLKN